MRKKERAQLTQDLKFQTSMNEARIQEAQKEAKHREATAKRAHALKVFKVILNIGVPREENLISAWRLRSSPISCSPRNNPYILNASTNPHS